MGKIINITDKFAPEGATILIGDKEYPIDTSIETVFKFEELASGATNKAMFDAMESALGKEAAKQLNIRKLKVNQFKTLVIAIMAALQDLTFEEADARFRAR